MSPHHNGMDLDLALQRAFAGRLGDVLEDMMPGGRLLGREYICASLQGGTGDGCKTDVITGAGTDTGSGRTWNHINELLEILYPDLDDFQFSLLLVERCEGLYMRIHSVGRQPLPARIAISPIPEDAPPRLEFHPRYGCPLKIWEYRSTNGRVLLYSALFESNGKSVIVPQYLSHTKQKGLVWMRKPMSSPRPLYNLDKLFKESAARQVLVLQNELEVDAAQKILTDIPCTCWRGGWKAINKVDLQLFVSETVYLWPENTQEGARKAERLAKRLKDNAELVFVVRMTDAFPEGWRFGDPFPKGIDPWELLDEALFRER